MRKWFLLQADVRNNKGKDCGIRGGGQQGKRSLVQAEVWTNKEKENGIDGGVDNKENELGLRKRL